MLELEEAAIVHVATLDPDLPVARLLAPRATFDGHQVRLFERLHGHKAGPELDEAALREIAAVHARLCLALRSFFHPAAGRELLWNLHAAPRLRPLLAEIADPTRRALVARVLDRYEERVLPRWERLRGQVVHGDFNLDNLLLDEHGRVAGILDFGDCCHTALAADVAVALASFLRGRPTEDAFRIARIALDGFTSRFPLEPLELELLGDLVGARLAAIVSISAWRSRRFPDNAAYIEAWDDDSWRLLELLDSLDPAAVARELGARRGRAASPELVRRRNAALGALLTPLTYALPRSRDPRRGRLDLRAGRKPAPRRLQQRPGRRALPPAGDRGGRPPDAARRDQREVPRRAAGRARRAVARHIPAGRGPRHGAARQLGQRGERPRLADRSRSDGTRRRARDGERVPRRHCRDDSALPRGLAGGAPAGRRSPHSRPRERRRPRRRVGRRARGAGRRARRDVPRRVAHERRDPRARDVRAPAARGADARRGRALRRGRGAGGPRPARAGALVVRAARHRTGRRDARQADGQRLPGRRGRDPARARRAVSVRGADVLDLRRQSGGCRRRARRARRARGRAAPRARCRRRRAPAYGRRDAPQAGRRRGARPGPPRRHPALEQRAGHSRHRGAARARDPRGTHGKARRRAQDPAAARVHG